ncbi:SLC5A, partial [Acrasis kona]
DIQEVQGIHWVDGIVIGVYFVFVFAVGIYCGFSKYFKRWYHKYIRRRLSSGNQESPDAEEEQNSNSSSFFLAGKDVSWWAVGCSLFASNIGSEHFIGLASSGAQDGICTSFGEWTSIFAIMLLAWLFVPYYLRSAVYTLPEFIEKRFSKSCRMYLTVISLVMYVLTKISVALFAGSIVFKVLLGWNIWVSATVLVVATGLYTVSGGLSAVIYTEVAQTFILIVGGITVFIICMVDVGGYSNLSKNLPDNMSHLWQPLNHPNFPWTGVVFGMPFVSIWYWCTDQVIVQRILSAKNLPSATRGCLLAGFMKILPPFMMVVPGMVSRSLYASVRKDPNTAFIVLVQNRLPIGARGIMMAAMLAALMSSLASVFHSSSTLFTMDIYREFKKRRQERSREETTSSIQEVDEQEILVHDESNEKEYVLVGRIAGVVVTIVGIAWIPLVQLLSQQLYIYTHKVMSYTAPPIAIVFLLGILWRRSNSYGAFTTMVVGFIFGMTRLILEAIITSNPNIYTKSPSFIHAILTVYIKSNFLNFCACFSLLSAIVMIVVSLATKAPSQDQTQWALTLSHLKDMFEGKDRSEPEQPEQPDIMSVESGSTQVEDVRPQRMSFLRNSVAHLVNVGLTLVLLGGVVALYIGFA